jgi:molecular chaperone HscC
MRGLLLSGMIIGIDLGTTNSLVALWRDGKAELVPNA